MKRVLWGMALSVLLTGSALAAGLQWSVPGTVRATTQTGWYRVVDGLSYHCNAGAPAPAPTSSVYFDQNSLSPVTANVADVCDTSVGTPTGFSSAASVAVTYLDTSGIELSGDAQSNTSGANCFNCTNNASSVVSGSFTVAEAGGIDILVNAIWYRAETGATANSDGSFSASLRYAGCYSPGCELLDINTAASVGNETRFLHLAAGTYSFMVSSSTSALSTCYVGPCSPAYGLPASYDVPYSFSMTVVPVPAAVWLFGSALGVMGVVRRKIPTKTTTAE